eukprot:1784120-Amphidinium_carterae.1
MLLLRLTLTSELGTCHDHVFDVEEGTSNGILLKTMGVTASRQCPLKARPSSASTFNKCDEALRQACSHLRILRLCTGTLSKN